MRKRRFAILAAVVLASGSARAGESLRGAPGPAPSTAAAVAAPGLGKADWKTLWMNPRSAAFFTPATAKRGPLAGRAWITEVFAGPTALAELRGVGVVQTLYVTDCANNTITSMQLAAWSPEGKPLYSAVNPSPTPRSVQPGTTQALLRDLLCGRPVDLASDPLIPGDVVHLRDIYATQRAFAALPGKPSAQEPARRR